MYLREEDADRFHVAGFGRAVAPVCVFSCVSFLFSFFFSFFLFFFFFFFCFSFLFSFPYSFFTSLLFCFLVLVLIANLLVISSPVRFVDLLFSGKDWEPYSRHSFVFFAGWLCWVFLFFFSFVGGSDDERDWVGPFWDGV